MLALVMPLFAGDYDILTPAHKGPNTARKFAPSPRVGAPPINGKYYTWEDDALNIRMREEEAKRPYKVWRLPAGATGSRTGETFQSRPSWDDPGRCRGFSTDKQRPCREWAQKNIDGDFTKFCLHHTQTNRVTHKEVIVMSPNSVVSGARTASRHGAYSAVIRQQLLVILDYKAGSNGEHSAAHKELTDLMSAMDAVNTDNPGESLDFAIKTTMGLYAMMLSKFASGNLKFGEFAVGIQLLNDSLRKLVGTKHDVLGTADDETERAINAVLERLGLGPSQAAGMGVGAFQNGGANGMGAFGANDMAGLALNGYADDDDDMESESVESEGEREREQGDEDGDDS
jgi:hypothetical protein